MCNWQVERKKQEANTRKRSKNERGENQMRKKMDGGKWENVDRKSEFRYEL